MEQPPAMIEKSWLVPINHPAYGFLSGTLKMVHSVPGLWGMEPTSVIQQKGLPKDDAFVIKGDSQMCHRGGCINPE